MPKASKVKKKVSKVKPVNKTKTKSKSLSKTKDTQKGPIKISNTYIPKEINRINNLISKARTALESDVESAKSISVKVGQEISNYLNMEKFALPNCAVTKNSITMMRIEPLKWWILGSGIPEFSSEEATDIDLSHSFTHLLQ